MKSRFHMLMSVEFCVVESGYLRKTNSSRRQDIRILLSLALMVLLSIASYKSRAQGFDKRLEYNWNLLAGIQWQINRTWQYRAEFGFLRNKQQIFTGLNYRFGIKRK